MKAGANSGLFQDSFLQSIAASEGPTSITTASSSAPLSLKARTRLFSWKLRQKLGGSRSFLATGICWIKEPLPCCDANESTSSLSDLPQRVKATLYGASGINKALGEGTTTRSTVNNQLLRLNEVNFSFADFPCTGRPLTSTTVCEVFWSSFRTPGFERWLHKLALPSAPLRFTVMLKATEVLSRWVSYALTETHSCASRLLLLRSRRSELPQDIVARAKSSMTRCLLASRHLPYPVNIIESTPVKGPTPLLLDSGECCDKSCCPTTRRLTSKLHAAASRVDRDVPLYTSCTTSDAAACHFCLPVQMVLHRLYSPNLATLDYLLYHPLKRSLKHKPFKSFTNLKFAVELFFDSQSPASGVREL
ncbi:hypothetical protein RB195_004775 [Necator americanus]|uniref:SOCS box domain-containing protein n=1 Tax=Necator americanus TaxID=51031 RepID=A0ABR1BNF9_NECAM